MDPKSSSSTATATDSSLDKMKTESDFRTQADKARAALQQFATILKMEEPSELLVKAAMESILKATVSPLYFSMASAFLIIRPLAPI